MSYAYRVVEYKYLKKYYYSVVWSLNLIIYAIANPAPFQRAMWCFKKKRLWSQLGLPRMEFGMHRKFLLEIVVVPGTALVCKRYCTRTSPQGDGPIVIPE